MKNLLEGAKLMEAISRMEETVVISAEMAGGMERMDGFQKYKT